MNCEIYKQFLSENLKNVYTMFFFKRSCFFMIPYLICDEILIQKLVSKIEIVL